MNRAYRYSFAPDIPSEDIESALLLSVIAAESLHGEADVRLDAGHVFDAAAGQCVVEATTPVGRDLCRLFTGFLRREFGDHAFRVEPAELASAVRSAPAASAI
jgi:hypothetical protein